MAYQTVYDKSHFQELEFREPTIVKRFNEMIIKN